MQKLWIILSNLAYLLSLPVWLFFFWLSPLAFDSGETLRPTLTVLLIGFYGLVALGSIIASAILWRRGRTRPANLISILPAGYFLALLLLDELTRPPRL